MTASSCRLPSTILGRVPGGSAAGPCRRDLWPCLRPDARGEPDPWRGRFRPEEAFVMALRTTRAPYWLSGALAAVAVVACGLTLYLPDVLHGPAAMNGSARGTALVLLVAGLPALMVA